MADTPQRENVIAFIWDFDKTLIPGYMEDPMFWYYGIDSHHFWDEVNHLPKLYKENGINHIAKDTLYLNHILTYVQKGVFHDLSNARLREFGKFLVFFKGIPQFFEDIKHVIAQNPVYHRYGIRVEHYIVSTGIKEMVLGSTIAPFIDGVWANEFIESIAQPDFLKDKRKIKLHKTIQQIGYIIDHTSKTRALFEINKGVNKMNKFDVNSFVSQEKRRVPFDQMIYIADGPSDIPAFSIINDRGGKTFAVYQPHSQLEFMQVSQLHKEKRVQLFGEADYSEGSYTRMALFQMADEIAQKIIHENPAPFLENTKAPRHIVNGKFVHEDEL